MPDSNQPMTFGGTDFRPKLGFALGAGAARGWAHIGVLRALVSHGIVPDIISGTSIGALVGGCYLGGRLEELEDFARSLNRSRLFRLLDLNLGGSGLITGSKLEKLLDKALDDILIENLQKSYICVATELGTGHEIWLRSGQLIRAMRASYAMPGIFEPVEIGGRYLVDGALVNPVPVSVCRALGARIVVAINMNTEQFGRGAISHPLSPARADASGDVNYEDVVDDKANFKKLLNRQFFARGAGLPGISGIMAEAFNIIQDRITRSRLASDPPDVMIGPKLGDFGLFDFHRAEEAIAIGYETGLASVAEIKGYVTALS